MNRIARAEIEAKNLLLVDDEPNVLSSLKRVLMDEPYEIHTARSGEEALQLLDHNDFQVVLSDERMPGMGGSEFLARLREIHPETVRIMLTGHASIEATMKAVNSGEIYRFFTKPWNDLELLMAIRSAMEKYDLEQEISRLRRIVLTQEAEIRHMEKRYPGISRVEKDRCGTILIPDIAGAEIEEILAECEKD